MKKTLLSLAAASLIVTSAVAADKGIDIVTTGQAVLYYETKADNGYTTTDNAGVTHRNSSDSLFDQNTAAASYGIQLNLDADLKNGFTFGSQLSYLGTAGLEKNLVSNTRQSTTTVGAMSNISDEIALTKIFIAKKIANTTVKVGRQELPKSLSPLAFSEGWNVFKNTFEAALLVNSDIPDTLVVAAYVGQGNGSSGTNFSTFGNLKTKVNIPGTGVNDASVAGTAYMLTIQNKSIPMTAITASYYDLAKVGENLSATTPASSIGATALWLDVAVADKSLPLGLKVGLQAGSIMPDSTFSNTIVGQVAMADTNAYGVKVGLAPIEALTLCAAYTSVDGDDQKTNVAVKNTGTGVKTPLFTQMIYNQDAISLDANTFMLKAAYNTGNYGTIIAQGAMTTAGKSNQMNRTINTVLTETDYTDLELVYKVKAGGVDFMAAYVSRSWSEKDTQNVDSEDAIRLVARYNF